MCEALTKYEGGVGREEKRRRKKKKTMNKSLYTFEKKIIGMNRPGLFKSRMIK